MGRGKYVLKPEKSVLNLSLVLQGSRKGRLPSYFKMEGRYEEGAGSGFGGGGQGEGGGRW